MPAANVNAKGRKIRGNFAHLPCDVLDSQAVATLSHAQFRVLVLMAAQFNGHNNGALGITAKQATDQGIASEHTFYGALRILEERDLIEKTHPASRVPPRPSMYALTWRPLDQTKYTEARRAAMNGFKIWRVK